MCEALDRMAHPEHLEALHKALETGACAPEDAEQLLLRFGERTAEPVCALLGQSSGEPMRRFYADLLVKIGAPVLESVVAHLRWPDPELQCHFVRVLGQLRDPCAAPELIEVLVSEDAAVRRETVRALALTGGEAAFETLLSLVLDDPDPSVRVVSLMCLGDARSRLDCEKVLARIKSPEFAALSSQEKDLLFQALAAAGGVEIIPELRRRLQASWIPGRSESENWRRTAAALAQIGTRAAIEVLDNGAKSRRPELARICGEFLKVAQQERP
jgi:HEAT repeat protein